MIEAWTVGVVVNAPGGRIALEAVSIARPAQILVGSEREVEDQFSDLRRKDFEQRAC